MDSTFLKRLRLSAGLSKHSKTHLNSVRTDTAEKLEIASLMKIRNFSTRLLICDRHYALDSARGMCNRYLLKGLLTVLEDVQNTSLTSSHV